MKKELRMDRLLQREEESEYGGKKWWERDFEFLLDQMKKPQVGTIGQSDRSSKEISSD